ncbi:MAG: glycosyltransferase family 4 protein [Planctomycetota bacterium]
MFTASHVVFSKPKWVGGVFHRGFMGTDYPTTLDEQIDRRLWAVALFFHAPIRPKFDKHIDIYFACPTFTDCPLPKVAVTDRDLTDENQFYPIANSQKKYDVIFNMNWMPFKRHELFLDALQYAKKAGREINVLWFGYHYQEESKKREKLCRQVVFEQGLNVDFADTVFDSAVTNERFNRCRVCVICSTGEGGPRVFAESLLAGLPLVVTNDTAGGVPEAVAAQCGIVCNPNAKELAEAIWKTLDEQDRFQTRQWALDNICLSKTMPRLIAAVQALSDASEIPINVADIAFTGYDWTCQTQQARKAEKEFQKENAIP